jgi:hypothetical protein
MKIINSRHPEEAQRADVRNPLKYIKITYEYF